jgi:hypothetical protein
MPERRFHGSLSDREAVEYDLEAGGYERSVKKGLKEDEAQQKKEVPFVDEEEIKELVESLYYEDDEFCRVVDVEILKKMLKDRENIQDQLFIYLLKIDPRSALDYIEYFKNLDSSVQKEIGTYLKENPQAYYNPTSILKAFDQIINKDLQDHLVSNLEFAFLADNKSKFPNLKTEKLWQIFQENFKQPPPYQKEIDWLRLVNFIDVFPSLNRYDIAQKCFDQDYKANRSRDEDYALKKIGEKGIIQRIIKLGISDQDLINLCFIYDYTNDLADHADIIDSALHPKIIDELKKRKDYAALLVGLRKFNFSKEERVALVNLIGQGGEDHDKQKGVKILCETPSYWGEFLPQLHEDIFNGLLEGPLDGLAHNLKLFGKELDKNRRDKLLEKLFDQKKFDSLIEGRKFLFPDLDDNERVLLIIQKGGVYGVIKNLDQFSDGLSREVFLQLLIPEEFLVANVARFIDKFSDITKEDIFNLFDQFSQGAFNNQIFIKKVIENIDKYDGLELKDFIAQIIKKDRTGVEHG